MRIEIHYAITFALVLLTAGCAALPASPVTPQDVGDDTRGVEEGFTPLFNGRDLTGWRSYGEGSAQNGWVAQEGELRLVSPQRVDLVTVATFEDFDLRFEWRVQTGGNSGVFYRFEERAGRPAWRTGPEYQLVDDLTHVTASVDLHRSGAAYDLYPPSPEAARPVGQFNEARIVVSRGAVQHWLNGSLVASYDLNSPAFRARVRASKFGESAVFALATATPIGLQDHGDPVAFRNVRIKRLNGT